MKAEQPEVISEEINRQNLTRRTCDLGLLYSLILIPMIGEKQMRHTSPRNDLRARSRSRVAAESLEVRNFLSATAWPGLLDPTCDVEPNETLDAAQEAGAVGNGQDAGLVGTIGNGAVTSRDVDWYQFTLDQAGHVQLVGLPGNDGSNSSVVVTLYGDQISEYDPAVPLAHRLLGRSEGLANGAAARIDVMLDAGTYFVAVSGAANRFFHPFLANSGAEGLGGDYGVQVSWRAEGVSPPVDGSIHEPGLGPTGGLTPSARLEDVAGDDIPNTANDLGDLTSVVRLQALGAIGDDPFYSYESEDPFAMNPAADVDLYHFTISGNGDYALVGEVLAGRIGSALDPALTLFRDNGGVLEFVATNDNTFNPAVSTNGMVPLFSDAALFVGLTAGDYYLAVSSAGNNAEWGPDGVFDPQSAHSGLNGYSVGDYVLDLLIYADSDTPQVVGQVFNLPGSPDVELLAGQVGNLPLSPTHFSLRFSEQVNLQQLAHEAFLQTNSSTVSSVFLQDANGQQYFPRLESYDSTTGTARFLMRDGLPTGALELHVSGPDGLTDLAGHPISGNDPSGDYVVRFTVDGPVRGSNGNSTTWTSGPANDSAEQPQDFGVLFPHELQAGVHFVRAGSAAVSVNDGGDFFRFEVLQHQSYFFTLTDSGDTPAAVFELLDANGQVISMNRSGGGEVLLGPLNPGVYILHVGSWSADASSGVAYQVAITLGGVSENPTPLTSGAGSAVGIRLLSNGPSIAQATLPAVVFSRPASQSLAAAPGGLLQGLEANALGIPSGNNRFDVGRPGSTTVVRLFGFSDRDRLFTLLDNGISRPTDRAVDNGLSDENGLTSADLFDLWATGMSARDEQVSDESDSETISATNEEADSEDSDETAQGQAGTSDDVVRETPERRTKDVSSVIQRRSNGINFDEKEENTDATREPVTQILFDELQELKHELELADSENANASAFPLAVALAAMSQSSIDANSSTDPASVVKCLVATRTRRNRKLKIGN